eukprot:5119847-Pleurochrysis_carterae.AAC.2
MCASEQASMIAPSPCSCVRDEEEGVKTQKQCQKGASKGNGKRKRCREGDKQKGNIGLRGRERGVGR